MNIEKTKKAIEVMQAFVDGKSIEYFDDGQWRRTNHPCWTWEGSLGAYRVKPEPMEIDAWTRDGKIFVPANDKREDFWTLSGWTKKKFREVIE